MSFHEEGCDFTGKRIRDLERQLAERTREFQDAKQQLENHPAYSEVVGRQAKDNSDLRMEVIKLREELKIQDQANEILTREVEEVRKCYVCGGTDVVCAKGWLKERESLQAKLEKRTKALEKINERWWEPKGNKSEVGSGFCVADCQANCTSDPKGLPHSDHCPFQIAHEALIEPTINLAGIDSKLIDGKSGGEGR